MKLWRFKPGSLKVGARVVDRGPSGRNPLYFTVTSVWQSHAGEWMVSGKDSQGRNCQGRQSDLRLTSLKLDPKAVEEVS